METRRWKCRCTWKRKCQEMLCGPQQKQKLKKMLTQRLKQKLTNKRRKLLEHKLEQHKQLAPMVAHKLLVARMRVCNMSVFCSWVCNTLVSSMSANSMLVSGSLVFNTLVSCRPPLNSCCHCHVSYYYFCIHYFWNRCFQNKYFCWSHCHIQFCRHHRICWNLFHFCQSFFRFFCLIFDNCWLNQSSCKLDYGDQIHSRPKLASIFPQKDWYSLI